MVERAELWRWSRLWARMHEDDATQAILSPWPAERPSDWLRRVDTPQSAKGDAAHGPSSTCGRASLSETATIRRMYPLSGKTNQPSLLLFRGTNGGQGIAASRRGPRHQQKDRLP
jgi:hypothetical protein